MRRCLTAICLIPFFFGIPAAFAARIFLLVIDADSFLVNEAIRGIRLPESIALRFFTRGELAHDREAEAFITRSDVVIVDVMAKDLSDYLIQRMDVRNKRVYALRGSRDDDALKARGFIFDPVGKTIGRELRTRYLNPLWIEGMKKEAYAGATMKREG